MIKRALGLSAMALILIMITAGCNPRGYGSLTMDISVSGAGTSAVSAVDHVVVRAVNGGLSKQSPSIILVGGMASYSFEGLPAGIWSMEATAYDLSGKGVYYGKTNAVVSRDVASRAELKLAPADGEYEMTVNLTGLDLSKVTKAEVWVYPLGVGTYAKKHVLVAPFSDIQTFTATSMKPRSYEYQIRTFDVNNAPYYNSPWFVFDVTPAGKTAVMARIDTSGFTIDMTLVSLPEAPTISSFSVSKLASGDLNFKADIGLVKPEELASMTVYYRFFETERFELLSTLAQAAMPATVSYSCDLKKDLAPDGTAWIIAVANGKNLLISTASQPAKYQVAP